MAHVTMIWHCWEYYTDFPSHAYKWFSYKFQIDGLVQERRNFSALAMELGRSLH